MREPNNHVAIPFAVGDNVVFVPDERTVRDYGRAFPRLGIFPGYVGKVERITADLVRVEQTLKAWPWQQFRRADSFADGEIEAYATSQERATYISHGTAPYHIADRVRFQPSAQCDLRHGAEYRAAGLFPSMIGHVTAIRNDDTIEIDGCGLFYHWSEFQLASDGAPSS